MRNHHTNQFGSVSYFPTLVRAPCSLFLNSRRSWGSEPSTGLAGTSVVLTTRISLGAAPNRYQPVICQFWIGISAKSLMLCKPIQIVYGPGIPSPLRLRNSPKYAIICITALTIDNLTPTRLTSVLPSAMLVVTGFYPLYSPRSITYYRGLLFLGA